MKSSTQSSNGRTAGELRGLRVLQMIICIGVVSSICVYLSLQHDPLSSSIHFSRLRLTPYLTKLERVLLNVAPDREVLMTLADMRYYETGVLKMWLEQVIACNVTNYIVIAIDDDLYQTLRSDGFNVYFIDRSQEAKAQHGTGANHEISAMKYGILSRILRLGWHVLLSDSDVLLFRNPFDHLYRDVDIEGSSDASTPSEAYGSIYYIDDPSMGWSRFAQGVRHFNLNSGLFYVRSNQRSIELMDRLRNRLRSEQYWDQQAFNEEIFFLTHGSYRSPGVSVRVMDINQFMNSKTLFKIVRKDRARTRDLPALVHVNYHPDKERRMKAILELYNYNDRRTFDELPSGSEPETE